MDNIKFYLVAFSLASFVHLFLVNLVSMIFKQEENDGYCPSGMPFVQCSYDDDQSAYTRVDVLQLSPEELKKRNDEMKQNHRDTMQKVKEIKERRNDINWYRYMLQSTIALGGLVSTLVFTYMGSLTWGFGIGYVCALIEAHYNHWTNMTQTTKIVVTSISIMVISFVARAIGV
jgi:FtsZ-binding cell division protein ZapB